MLLIGTLWIKTSNFFKIFLGFNYVLIHINRFIGSAQGNNVECKKRLMNFMKIFHNPSLQLKLIKLYASSDVISLIFSDL